jgi:two-component system, chemotaxis family, response regulator Rcp1
MSEATLDRRARILLVEDNPADVDLLRRALAHAGLDCELTVIDDGADALALVRQGGESAGGLDLAILDLNLPKHSGMEVLAEIRSSRVFANLPVIVLSSSSSLPDRARSEGFGVRKYIVKPPDLEEFYKIGHDVKELLVECRTRG